MKKLIDRDVRKRLLHVMDIIRLYDDWLTVNDIIFNLKRSDSDYPVERRAIYNDINALQDFGYILVKKGKSNVTFVKWSNTVYSAKVIQPKRVSECTLF